MDPIIIGILIGIIPTCLILGLWLRQVYSEKDSLTTNLTQANQRNQSLSTELEELKQDRSRLGSDLENANQRNEELGQEVTTLDSRLEAQHRRNLDLERDNAQLTSEVERANQRIDTLETELAQEQQRRAELEDELAAEQQRNAILTTERDQERETNARLTGSLVEVSQSNENALWLLYLSEQSLQSCGGALLSEQHRYQGLEENYETLHRGYRKTADDYGAFRKEVQSKAKKRLVKKGIGVALSFLPGVGLIDVLSDLGEIAITAGAAAEATDELRDTLNELPDPGELPTEGEFEPLSFSTDGEEIPAGLTPEAQDTVNEVLAQSLSEAGETPSPNAFSAFALGAIQRLESQVDAEQNEGIQRAMAIAKTANNFRQFGIQVYDYHGSRDPQQEENRSSSGDEA